MGTKLSYQQIDTRLRDFPNWRRENDTIKRELKFKDFVEAFGFMTQVAFEAEKLNHHPDWYNVYNQVHVTLSTHDVGGITDLDFKLASIIDRKAGAIV